MNIKKSQRKHICQDREALKQARKIASEGNERNA